MSQNETKLLKEPLWRASKIIIEKTRVVYNRTRCIVIVNKLDVEVNTQKTMNTAVQTGIAAVITVVEETKGMIHILLSNPETRMMNSSVHVNKMLGFSLLTTSLMILSIYSSSLDMTAQKWRVNLIISTIRMVKNVLEEKKILKLNTKTSHVENRNRPWRRKQGSNNRINNLITCHHAFIR